MSDRKVQLNYSNDGGRNWSNLRTKSIGETGEYAKRVRFLSLGAFVNRTWRVVVSSPVKRDLLGAVVTVEGADQ